MALSSSWVNGARSAFLCRYWRSSRFVFSLVPRCHGWCGSQKNTGSDSAAVIAEWPSRRRGPRSTTAAGLPAADPSGRSTRGPPRRPCSRRAAPRPSRNGWRGQRGWPPPSGRASNTRSPSQWPATCRVSASVGRSRMETMLRIWPRPCERFFPRGRRIERSLRKTVKHLASNTFRDGISRSR